MFNQYKRRSSLSGIDIGSLSSEDLKPFVRDIMETGIHGLGFSPCMDGQDSKTIISPEQIKERLAIIAPHVEWVRSFSCQLGSEHIPSIAAGMGLKTMVGVWIDDDLEMNEKELAAGIEIANAGHADILAIGNEALLREEMTDGELIRYIERAKAAVPSHVTVGYVDAYFLFENHPAVAEACDALLVNCYPFWEDTPAEHAHVYMKEMYRRAQIAAKGKRVIVAETGWPDRGTPQGRSVPSPLNAMKYFIDAARWAEEEGIDLFYFAAFDEEWKVAKEGDVGAYWGLWDKNGHPKYW